MATLLPIGSKIVWIFPGSGNRYAGVVTEAHAAKNRGEEERYRVKGENMDCYAFRRDLEVVE